MLDPLKFPRPFFSFKPSEGQGDLTSLYLCLDREDTLQECPEEQEEARGQGQGQATGSSWICFRKSIRKTSHASYAILFATRCLHLEVQSIGDMATVALHVSLLGHS